MNLLSIDSAVTPACALFCENQLLEVGFEKWPKILLPLDVVVVEQWQYRGIADAPKVPNLIKMMTGGLLAAGYAAGGSRCPVVLYTPKEWKGEEPKPVHHARLLGVDTAGALDAGEINLLALAAEMSATKLLDTVRRAVERGALDRWGKAGHLYYPSAFKFHNILDAVALGCFHIGRLEKHG